MYPKFFKTWSKWEIWIKSVRLQQSKITASSQLYWFLNIWALNAHNPKVKGSHPLPATKTVKGRPQRDVLFLLLPSTNITIDAINAKHYAYSMIQSFSDKETAAIFAGYLVRRLPQDMQQVARRKLKQLDAARLPDELKIPPGNRLEALKGDRKGQWSIRVNDQWRICFIWNNGDAEDVQIVDYH